ncbi:MAG TPA: rod shape-determining protein MreD [Rhizomicrobium sp.]|nr:rod shape-determining protein MreD [Rhizomicrobium sp.]
MERAVNNMGGFLSNAIPFLLAFAGILVANFPVSLMNGRVPPPLFVLMPIYYWTLVRPDLMRPMAVVALGLVQDLLSGSPMGVWTLSFVITYAVIDYSRDTFAGLGGIYAILGFATAAFIACGSAYLIVTVYFWRLSSIVPLATELAMTVLFYVPLVVLLGRIHHRFVGPLRRDF